VTRLLLLLAIVFPTQALGLSQAAQEFLSISKQLEAVQCEKRRLRRAIAARVVETPFVSGRTAGRPAR